MKEIDIESKACKEAEAAGWLVRKVKFINRKNAPDRMFAKYGRAVFIEFKRPGQAPRASQSQEIKLLRDAGMEVYVCDRLDQARKCLGLPTPA